MSEPSKFPAKYIEGIKYPATFSEEVVRSVINYKPRDDDVLVVTYPKCGTTWTCHILSLIFRHGEPFADTRNYFLNSPFVEATGASLTETMIRPGTIKMHLPFRLTPWSEKAKYIYVARNPKDCCVSYFHHVKNVPVHDFNGTFDDFFGEFMSGGVDHGDYFDHLLGWYPHRNEPNVLFLTYEEIKENIEEAIIKMASFIDDEKYAEPLRKDPKKMASVMKHSSLEEMKKTINTRMDEMFFNSRDSGAPQEIIQFMSNMPKKEKMSKSTNFIRKGIVGGWRNHLSEDQSRRMDRKCSEKFNGTELAILWAKYM